MFGTMRQLDALRARSTMASHPPLCPDRRVWILAVSVALIDLLWILASDHTISWTYFTLPALIGAICGAWHCAGFLVPLRHGPRSLALVIGFVMFSVPFATLFGQLVMTVPFPMADALLANWDGALGLDWTGYLSWVVARPWLSKALSWVYYSILQAPVVALLVLHALGRRERVSELLALAYLSVIITATIGSAFPALGAPTFHQAQMLMAAFPAHTGAQWVDRLAELRSGLPVDLTEAEGLISFPSYHVALVLCIAWACRGITIAFPISMVFAIGTIAATPIIGGHYFVDLIGGAALIGILISVNHIRRARIIAPTEIHDRA